MKKVVSIGCGGAGMFSAIVATQLKKDQIEAVVLSDENDIYCRCTTPYVLAGEATIKDAVQPDSMIEDYGPKIMHEKAVSIDTAKKQVTTSGGQVIEYDYLVLATGAMPVKPSIPGIDGQNIFTMRTSTDAEILLQRLTEAKTAVIVGAGVIGIEMAGALCRKGIKVQLVEYSDSISPAIADQEFAEKILGLLKANGIEVLLGHQVTEIKDVPDGKELTVVASGQKKNLTADMIVVAAGVKPNLDILRGTNIKAVEQGIVVDAKMRTNIKNVFACGDCCVPLSAVTGELKPSPLASSAIQESKVVGFQIAGYPITFNGSTGAFAFKTLEKEYAAAGLTEELARKKFKWVVVGRASTTDVYRDLKGHQPLEVKLIFAGPRMRLVGYEAFGNGLISSAEVASFAIGLRLSILKMLKFNYIAHPSLTPWPFMNPIIMASEDAMGNIMKVLKKFLPFI